MLRIVVILGCCCVVTANAIAARAYQAESVSATTTVPFDAGNNLIVINAAINGRGSFRFLIDTGSSVDVLSQEVAGIIGLRTNGGAKVDVAGNMLSDATLMQVSEIRIGDLALRDQPFFVAPLPKKWPFHGILGGPLFKKFAVTIDFAQSQIKLTRLAIASVPTSAKRIPITLRDGLIPRAKGEIDRRSGWWKIDTGYNGGVAVFAEFARRHRSLVNSDSLVPGYPEGGQIMTGEITRVRGLKIKVLKLKTTDGSELIQEHITAALFTEKGGSNSAYAGALGILVLRSFRVTFDYARKLMILEKPEAR